MKTIGKPLEGCIIGNEQEVPIPVPTPVREEEAKTVDTSLSEDPESNCQITGMDEVWVKRCESLYTSGIPKDALSYALQTLKANANSFETSKCYKMASSSHYSMGQGKVTKSSFEKEMSGGLKNKCQFIINDTRSKLSNCQGQMYYIDLCTDSDKQRVTKDYFNLGVGTCEDGHGFKNAEGYGTTLKGAFFSSNYLFDLNNSSEEFENTRKQVAAAGGPSEVVSLQLFGLQNSNNTSSESFKYLHVSPRDWSRGCTSVRPENYYMIQQMAKNGPSLVLNYGENMEDIGKCTQ
jgi:hypothetical protein